MRKSYIIFIILLILITSFSSVNSIVNNDLKEKNNF
jgi:hypothetical protein